MKKNEKTKFTFGARDFGAPRLELQLAQGMKGGGEGGGEGGGTILTRKTKVALT